MGDLSRATEGCAQRKERGAGGGSACRPTNFEGKRKKRNRMAVRAGSASLREGLLDAIDPPRRRATCPAASKPTPQKWCVNRRIRRRTSAGFMQGALNCRSSDRLTVCGSAPPPGPRNAPIPPASVPQTRLHAAENVANCRRYLFRGGCSAVIPHPSPGGPPSGWEVEGGRKGGQWSRCKSPNASPTRTLGVWG